MSMNETRKKLLELDAYIKASMKDIFGTDEISFGVSVHQLTTEQVLIIDDDPKLEQVDHGFGEGNVHYYSSSGHRRRVKELLETKAKGLRDWTFFTNEWKCTESKISHSNCDPNKQQKQGEDNDESKD